jgi:YD repeat-containing protein
MATADAQQCTAKRRSVGTVRSEATVLTADDVGASMIRRCSGWMRVRATHGAESQRIFGCHIIAVVAWAAALCVVATAFADPPGVEYGYDELGRLVFVSDQTGSAAMYTYDAVGNLIAIGRVDSASLTDPVVITAVIPARGAVGTSVSVFGKGFSDIPSQNAVSFNGGPATVTFATPTRLIVSVPSSATTGTVAVTAPLGSANSPNPFTVLGQ